MTERPKDQKTNGLIMEHANLADRPLPAVFLDISEAEETFVLSCCHSRAEKLFLFAAGEVAFLSRGESTTPDLADLILEAQRLTPVQISAAKNKQKTTGTFFGDVLVDLKIMSREEMDEFIERVYELTIAELLRWEEGDCEYGKSDVPEELFDEQAIPVRLPIPGFELAGASAHIAGAWENILLKSNEPDPVLKLATDKLSAIDTLRFPGGVKEDIKYINGIRPVSDFILLSSGTVFSSIALLSELINEGVALPAGEGAGEDERGPGEGEPEPTRREKTSVSTLSRSQADELMRDSPKTGQGTERPPTSRRDPSRELSESTADRIKKAPVEALKKEVVSREWSESTIDRIMTPHKEEESSGIGVKAKRAAEDKSGGFEFQSEEEQDQTGDRLLIAGRAALDAEDKIEAERLFREAVDLFSVEGAGSGVIVALDELLTLKDNDLELLVKKFETLLEKKKKGEAQEAANKIVAVGKAHPFPNTAVKALEKVVAEYSDDVEIKAVLAEALARNEERARAAGLYAEVAQGCEGRGMREPALRFFEKAHDLDPDNARYTEAVNRLQGKKRAAGVPRRLVATIVGVLAAVAVLGGAGYYFFVHRPGARNAFDSAMKDMTILMKAKPPDFAGAKRLFADLKKKYPYSGIESEVDEQLKWLASQESIAAKGTGGPGGPKVRPDTLPPKPSKDRKREATEIMAKAQKLEKEGQYSTAFLLYKRLQKEYWDSPEARNVRFPMRVKSSPPGAEVFLGGRKVGVTPALIHYKAEDVVDDYLELEFRLRGFTIDRGATTYLASSFLDVTAKLQKIPVWMWEIGRPVEVTPTIAGEVFACPARAGLTYCFAFTEDVGESETPVRWRFKNGLFGDIVSELTYSDGILYGTNTNRSLFAVDVEKRNLKWVVDLGASARTRPAVGDNNVIGVGTNKGVFTILDGRTGSVVSTVQFENRIYSGAVYKGGVFYIGGTDNTVRAYNVGSRSFLWARDVPDDVVANLAISGSTLFVPCADGSLYALEAENGSEIWQYETHGKLVAEPLIDGDVVYFSSSDGAVYAVDLKGKKKWRFKTERPVVSKPALASRRIYVTSTDKNIYALDRSSGKEVWRYTADDAFVGGPVYSGGLLICVTRKGTVYAFED
ncbi:MAG: hypothetical protein E3J72_12615 [Planctomycetota bacterium]|nr:MAG: hypothetical protein E3J72_12615 [Planctomycetota bacterium]